MHWLPLMALAASAQQPPAVFQSGTRLVEVEVVVRGKHVRDPGAKAFFRDLFDAGPPFGPPGPPLQGLTKDDFKLLDNNKPQPIAFVHGGPDIGPGASLPPGAVSNRIGSSGKPVNNATVVLIDQLNTSPDLLAYERKGVANMLRSLSASSSSESADRVALYTMGKNLHVLQDFTGNEERLLQLAAKLDQPHGAPELNEAFKDFGGLFAWTIPDDGSPIVPDPLGTAARMEMTTNALRVVIQHLARVSGRKNLVWLTAEPPSPPVTAMLLQANITLYPVMVRSVGCFACPADELDREREFSTGGRAFLDAMDLSFAVHTAEEDSSSAYTLGFYPAEEMLDGKYHRLTVKLRDSTLELHYRNGYLATKSAPRAPVVTSQALLNDPLQATGIGLTAQLKPDPSTAGKREVEVTVDLHDVHLQLEDGHFKGAFDIFMMNPKWPTLRSDRVEVNFREAMLAKAMETGYKVVIPGIDSAATEIRIAVRDPGTLAAGSLRIPVPAHDAE